MTSLFKDFEKDTKGEAINRFVTTPTVEQLYEVDKKAVDNFLDEDLKEIKKGADKLKEKPKEELTGTESLYLRVANTFPSEHNFVDGNEGLFGTVWSLIKRFLSMIGNFFKWLAETFFGFGKRSQTEYNKLKAQLETGEINYDTELSYPATTKNLINPQKYTTLPKDLDWLRLETDTLVKLSQGVVKTFTDAKGLFTKVQNKKVSVEDVEAFTKSVEKDLKVGASTPSLFRITGSTWAVISYDKEKSGQFNTTLVKHIEVKADDKFKVSESIYEKLVDNLSKTSTQLMNLAEISKKEKDLFGAKLTTEKDLQGMGTAEAYAMSMAFKALVSYIGFIKTVMTAIQHADSAAHAIMKKAFK